MQPLSHEQIERLAEKMLLGTITPEERDVLNEWATRMPGDELHWASGDKDEAALKNRLLNRIRESVGLTRPLPRTRRVYQTAAAVMLFVAAGLTYLFLHRPAGEPTVAAVGVKPASTGAPGHNSATLSLSGGRTILLDSSARDTIITDGGSAMANIEGRLTYHPANNSGAAFVFNTLSTARGGQYQLSLPDGTKAWLNAGSSITYPTVFTGTDRRVSITGEVYFEVAPSPRRPFIVNTGETEVTVLGTHFDVMAYKDEDHLFTTLIEGAVRVRHNAQTTKLIPGEQARVDKTTTYIKVMKVDTDDAVAWVNGKLSLECDDIHMLMRQIGRWYDMDIQYEGSPPNARLFGTINRNVNLSDVLTALANYGIKTRISGSTIIVSTK